MTNAELKSYVERAKELEAAIYTQKELMNGHQSLMDEQCPVKPQRQMIQEPECPVEPNEQGGAVFGIFMGGAFLALSIPFLTLGVFGWAIIGGIIGFLLLATNISFIRDNKKAKGTYQVKLQRYQIAKEEYIEEQKRLEEAFDDTLRTYNARYGEYAYEKSKMTEQHNYALALLVKALEEHYSLDIVYPKYRNLVAISAIDEYLSSGRCDKLEGADGAYNLYEMELRQNIVIGQLSAVIDDLEKIRSNQYSLYHELTKANKTVNSILAEVRGIGADACLTAYFSEVTAIAASAPRYTISL